MFTGTKKLGTYWIEPGTPHNSNPQPYPLSDWASPDGEPAYTTAILKKENF
jgi:hypothetical protein